MLAVTRPVATPTHVAWQSRLNHTWRHWRVAIAWLAACIVLPLGLAACGGSGSASPIISVSAVIGAAGGTVDGPDGVQVIIPPGALNQDTTIGIARSSVGAPDALDAYPVTGFVYELTPHDVPFNVPVTVRAPVSNGPDTEVFMASREQPWITTPVTVANGIAQWQLSSFSWMYTGVCGIPSSMLNDPHWCARDRSTAYINATPAESMIQTEFPRDPANGAFGTYRVDRDATLQLSQFVRVPGNCSNVTVRFLRRRWADPQNWWHPDVVAQTQTLPTLSPAMTAGPTYLTGTATMTVPVSYLDGGHNQFVMAASFDCPRIIRSANGSGGFNYSWDNVNLRHINMRGDAIIVEVNIPTPTVLYTVGGTVSGLTGTGLVLQNSAGDNLAVAANATSFTFTTPAGAGAPYAVTVLTQPTGQTCTVTNASGTASANVSNVVVTCVAASGNSILPRFAYVSNVNDNSLSIFTVNAATGQLQDIGFVATGTNPQSVTVSPSGKFAYVANYGSNDVSAYSINSVTGALTSVGAAIPAGTNPYLVAVDPTGKFAYVANFGSANVSAYSINATTGALTPASTVAAGTQPISVTVDPTGKFAYVAANSGVLRAYTVNATTGALTMVSDAVPAPGFSLRNVTVDPSGKFAYAPVAFSGVVMAYTIDSVTGALTTVAGSPFTAGNFPISVAIDPTGKFAYVANYDSGNVSCFTINATTGSLSPIGIVTAGIHPSFINVDPSGKFAFVTNQDSNTISGYSINAITGVLTALPAVVSRSGPSSVTTIP